MPIGNASPQVTTMAPSDSRMVSHSRSPMTSVTGRPYSNERPKLPLATMASHFQYCTHSGWFRP